MRFAIDTNLFIHYKPFTEVDWKGLLKDKDLILILPETVLKELDEKKFEGSTFEIRERAREAIANIDKYLDSGPMPNGVAIQSCPPFIEPDWPSLRLNQHNQDHRILVELLALRQVSPEEEICIVTADLGMKLTATIHGIKVVSPPDEWKRELKNPTLKELEKTRKELAQFRDQLPNVEIKFRVAGEIQDRLSISMEAREKEILTDNEISDKVEQKRTSLRLFPAPALPLHPMALQIFRVPPQETERYEQECIQHLVRYEEYLREVQTAQKELILVIEIRPVLTNNGVTVADDIDVWLFFPDDVEVLEKDGLHDLPEEPEGPEPPRTLINAISRQERVLGMTNILPFAGVSRVEADRPVVKGPLISEVDPHEVHYWLRKLKHHLYWDFDPVYIKFLEGKPHSFGISYSISVGNHPESREGTLPVIVEGNTR